MHFAIINGLLLFLLTPENISAQDSVSATPCEIIIDDFANVIKEENEIPSLRGSSDEIGFEDFVTMINRTGISTRTIEAMTLLCFLT